MYMKSRNYDFYSIVNEKNTNFYWRVKLLTKSIESKKNEDNSKYLNAKDEFQKKISEYKSFVKTQSNLLGTIDLYIPHPDLKLLPKYSFFIQFKFYLKKPFYSNNDDDFYIIENSITKENVFNIPMMRASSWKGNLRNTIIKINNIEEDPESSTIIQRLFGYTTKEGANQKKGRLIFYPTYFDQIGLETIAPHDRNTKTVKNPILYEVVPTGSSGFFSLLYIPFDLIGVENPNLEEIKEDYKQISDAIKNMMKTHGFGAKTSSGYGVVEDGIENIILEINSPSLGTYSPQLSNTNTVQDFAKLISLEAKV